jgi:hypothetical protein
MRTFDLAVHLSTRRTHRSVRARIHWSGGLVHATLRKAQEAGRLILAHRDVEWVNVIGVTKVSRGILRRRRTP